jgi:polar amino acid transport system substrate-binding protein
MTGRIRHPRRGRRARVALVGLVAAAAVLTGCAYEATPMPAAPESPAAEGAEEPPPPCDTEQAVRSYAPAGASRGDAVDQLINRGRVVVGVSADSYLLGSRNPFEGRIEGFDIDIAEAVAEALDVDLELRVITAAERIDLLDEGEIDLVVRNMTINCERWEEVAFSGEYYRAGQKVLLRDDLARGYSGPQDLADVSVCAPTGTSSIDNIREEQPEATIVAADTHTGCLVLFQQGRVDAITGDDTVLAGLAAQDPYAAVPEQDAFSEEPYGVAANSADRDLVRFVNQVLEQMSSDGSWQRSYDRWLAPTLGDASPPQPKYGR